MSVCGGHDSDGGLTLVMVVVAEVVGAITTLVTSTMGSAYVAAPMGASMTA